MAHIKTRSFLFVLLANAAALSGATQGPRWDNRFFLQGINGAVNAVAVSGETVYIGGKFTAAKGVPATNIAVWNGTNWAALGEGVNGVVNALALRGNELYVGGTFTAAGGLSVNRVAKWNGTNWSALGTGIGSNSVNALALSPGGVLYAAGDFATAGSVAATNVAQWDGSSWAALGGGVSDVYQAYASALAIVGNDLYVGGYFTSAGNVSANNLAKWNGSSWSAVGGGVDDLNYPAQVAALAVRGKDLFVGGSFSTAGNVDANNIAKWDGTNWTALDLGLGRYYGDLPVLSLAATAERLIVGGRFVSAGAFPADNLAFWDGTNWTEVGVGVSGKINAVASLGSSVLAGGAFTVADGLKNLAQWDGESWSTPGTMPGEGIVGTAVAAMEIQDTNVFVGGTFAFAGGVLASNIARWDGVGWFPLGGGMNGDVYALCLAGRDLVAGGSFTMAGGVSANHIARWDGTTWHPLQNGVSGTVYALASRSNRVFVGGSFTSANGTVVSNIACWDGAGWSALGTGVNGSVRALALSSNRLFAGGSFKVAGGVPATNVAQWDGVSWSALAGGVSGIVNPLARVRPPPVSALALRGDDLFVGGDFALAGAQPATNIARWDGTNWHALAEGLLASASMYPPPSVSALKVSGSTLLAAGTFTNAGGLGARNFAFWNGSTWLVPGVVSGGDATPSVLALAVNGADIFVGGSFQFAESQPASDFCMWSWPVALSICRMADGLKISWPACLDGYSLQAVPDLDASAWTQMTSKPVVQGATNELHLGHELNHAKFFRLQKD